MHMSMCFTHNRVRAFFYSVEGLEYLYCMSQLGLAVNCVLITWSAIHCVTSYIMLNDLSACWRLIVLKWLQKESYFIYTCFVYFFFFFANSSFNVSKCFFYSSAYRIMWCQAAKFKRCGVRQHQIANVLKVISHGWGRSSGYLTWRLMKKKIHPPLVLQVLHSSWFTISQFHLLLPDISTIMFAVSIIPDKNTYNTTGRYQTTRNTYILAN